MTGLVFDQHEVKANQKKENDLKLGESDLTEEKSDLTYPIPISYWIKEVGYLLKYNSLRSV